MIERHQDYQLSLPAVPPGGLFNVPLKLDSDAPFLLRRVKTRNVGAGGFRFRTARDLYQSEGFRTDLVSNGVGLLTPSAAGGIIVYPEEYYPVNGTIVVDVANTTGSPLTNARLLFRGSKLFPDGALPAPTYPAKLSALPYTYPVVVANIPVTGTSAVVPGLKTAAVLNNILNIQSDSDFVLRYMCADPFAMSIDGGVNPPPQTFQEVYVQLRDESRKPYSNEPIHVDDLFTRGKPLPAGLNNSPNLFFPGLLTPEVYLTKEAAYYFDVYRDDSAFLNQFPVTIHFRFQGAKVFAR